MEADSTGELAVAAAQSLAEHREAGSRMEVNALHERLFSQLPKLRDSHRDCT